jgi:hypothetical protein
MPISIGFRRSALLGAAALSLAVIASPASAQEISENGTWQFETPQALAARTAALDIMMKRRGGIYAAPIYNTHIARQYNCTVTATAAGNSDTQSATANSPGVTGANAASSGNSGTTQYAGASDNPAIDLNQHNSGSVGSTAIGATSAHVSAPAWQALNSTQTNSGDQTATVTGSTACGFGALN